MRVIPLGWLIGLATVLSNGSAAGLVGVRGFEPRISASQAQRVTNFATPRMLWSQPGRLSFVLSAKGSRTGPDSPCIQGEKHWLLSSSVESNAGEGTGAPGSCLASLPVPFRVFRGSGGGNRTHDLSVMSAPSCRCSTPHESVIPQDVVGAQVQKPATIWPTGNQQYRPSFLMFTSPQDIAVNHVTCSLSAQVYVMLDIDSEFPALPEIPDSSRQNAANPGGNRWPS